MAASQIAEAARRIAENGGEFARCGISIQASGVK